MAHARREYKDPDKPWERQEWEDDKTYHYFECYRNLPRHSRSTKAAYRHATGRLKAKAAPGTWTERCTKYEWIYRCEKYDQVGRLERISREAERLEDIRLDALQIIHDKIRLLGNSLDETSKPYDIAFGINTLARTVDLLAIKKQPGEGSKGGNTPEYVDPWLVNSSKKDSSKKEHLA